VFAYVRDEESRLRIARMRDAGVELLEPVVANESEQTLLGRGVVVTGSVEGYSRDGAAAAVLARGGTCPGSVSAKTYVVVVGDAPGANKVTKATDLGIPMIPGSAFEELLETGTWSTTLE